jgi:hypothetical protein
MNDQPGQRSRRDYLLLIENRFLDRRPAAPEVLQLLLVVDPIDLLRICGAG